MIFGGFLTMVQTAQELMALIQERGIQMIDF